MQRSGGRLSCAAFMLFVCAFCWLVFMSCQGYFCLLEAPGQHISTSVYRVCWLRARRVSALRAPLSLRCPDGSFIPTGWETLTPFSVSQRHSQWRSKASYRFTDDLDQVPTSHLVTHLYYAAIQPHLCFVDDKCRLATFGIFHLKALRCEIKPHLADLAELMFCQIPAAL